MASSFLFVLPPANVVTFVQKGSAGHNILQSYSTCLTDVCLLQGLFKCLVPWVLYYSTCLSSDFVSVQCTLGKFLFFLFYSTFKLAEIKEVLRFCGFGFDVLLDFCCICSTGDCTDTTPGQAAEERVKRDHGVATYDPKSRCGSLTHA